MKLSLTLVFALALLTACGPSVAEQHAIGSVFVQLTDAGKNATHPTGKRKGPQLNVPEYIAAIEQIDASHCPKKFALAWLDFVQTMRRSANGLDFLGESSISAIELVAGTAKLDPAAIKDARQRQDLFDVQARLDALERIALESGVHLQRVN